MLETFATFGRIPTRHVLLPCTPFLSPAAAAPKRRQLKCRASDASAQPAIGKPPSSTIKQFLLDRFLPVGLLTAMLIGYGPACCQNKQCSILNIACSDSKHMLSIAFHVELGELISELVCQADSAVYSDLHCCTPVCEQVDCSS